MTTDHVARWLCCAKAITVLAVAKLCADGLLSFQMPVCRLIPSFAQCGKEGVTIGHLLTHTIPYKSWGVRFSTLGATPEDEGNLPFLEWEAAVEAINRSELDGELGSEVVYTSSASWHILAEVIQIASGRSFERFVDSAVLRPLGMRNTYMTLNAAEYRALSSRLAPLNDLENGSVRPIDYDCEPWAVDHRCPGYGARGTVADLAKPFECVVNGGVGLEGPVITDAMVRELTASRRFGLPDGLYAGVDVRWGYGFCTDGFPFGLPRDGNIIGLTGYRSSFVMADIDNGIVIAYVATARLPFMSDRTRKLRIIRAVYADLGA